ncbi:DUF3383 domain-containing protein [Bradyrhizobium sp. LjRoot220]|uniref:DUF3383 domain-containing protein n=1 Tax=Bradyrhizobium sp. LjRoot220 TaxID=3342284 RepID=UPI003ED12415
MSTIPVSEVVRVTPGVLPAGGSARTITGLVLTTNTRVPIGTVAAFSSPEAVGNYFGFDAAEYQNSLKYFAGFDGSNKRPASMLFVQYPLTNVAAYVRGGDVSQLTLAQLQGFSGTLSVTIDGVLKTGSVNLSGATSFTNAAIIIANSLDIEGAVAATATGSIAGTVFTAASALTGTFAPGQRISGGTTAADTTILAQLTGPTGGLGTYTVSISQTVASATITAHAQAVAYDSVSGAFVINSGTAGASSTITYGSGAMATDLKLTSALGAVLSQGAAATTPSAFMGALVQGNRGFATFMLNFNPDVSGNDIRFAFAQWNGTQNSRFAYVAIDDDAAPTVSTPAAACLAQRIAAAEIDGTVCNWQPPASDLVNPTVAIDYGSLAAFVCGSAASIDFTQTDGRITFKFRKQSGLQVGVTDQTVFDNLVANGYNCYGAYADGDDTFTWYANGVVSGDFLWFDTYVNQMWLNGSFRNDLVTLAQNAKSIPYNAAGRATIEAALAGTINQGLSFGAYRSGVTLSPSQIADVNASANISISDTLTAQGWYLFVGDADPTTRQARQSPPMTFYYVDGESVQEFDLASIALQ